jgi:hypothetical protein
MQSFQVSFPIRPNLKAEIHFKGGRFVTPYFSKRIEFYKFIYLNKHLFVAFHAKTYFPLCCDVFLYFTVRVEVVEIQI